MNRSRNESQTERGGLIRALIAKRRSAARPHHPLPLRPIPQSEFEASDTAVVYRLGHSTVLIRLDGSYFLTDPVFCNRASPFQWIGPKRFQQTPVSPEDLPPISAVVISHDHYDHLDKSAILQIKDRVECFVVPLGVGRRLRKWGVGRGQIIECEWWQSLSLGGVNLTATPTQHFTGRSLFDRDKTLAASWVIEGAQGRLFFGGDSGYFSGFREIGERFGGFDLTMLENGAYSRYWKKVHMAPEETLQAHVDLQGQALMPIHNATFDLAFHKWFEPMERLHRLAESNGVPVITPIFGEKVNALMPEPTRAWWRGLESDALDVATKHVGTLIPADSGRI